MPWCCAREGDFVTDALSMEGLPLEKMYASIPFDDCREASPGPASGFRSRESYASIKESIASGESVKEDSASACPREARVTALKSL